MKYANQLGYTDVNPYEVVRKVSEKTLEIRPMNATADKSVELKWVTGGYCGHCINQRDQKWFIESDVEAPVIRIRLGKKGWKDAYGNRYDLDDRPIKFHDYNF